MWNVTFDSGNACAGIYTSDTDFGPEICPFAGNATYSPTCKYNTCSPCDCDCATCFGPDYYLCSSCPAGRYLHSIQLNCVGGCSGGYFANTSSGTCDQCDSSCATCSGPSHHECLSCHTPKLLSPNGTTCIDACPDGSGPDYDSPGGYKCIPCSLPCATCNQTKRGGITPCLSCLEGYLFQPPYNYCVETCEDKYYADTESGTCEPCDRRCILCTAAGTENCISCNYSHNPRHYLQPYSTVCAPTCPDGYFGTLSNSQGACVLCPGNCKTCLGGGSSILCTSCFSPYFLHNQICQLSCPDGYYPDSTNNTCTPCNEACAVCSGPLNTPCSSCKNGYYLYLNSSSSLVCLSSCPEGYFGSFGVNQCISCFQSCRTCSGTANFECISCKSGYFLQPYSNLCLSTCPTGYYQNTVSSMCSPCHSACLTCFGEDTTQCLSCQSGYFFLQSSSACLSSCPTGYWTDMSKNTKNICTSCHHSCTSCTGPASTQCSACSSRYYLQPSSTTCSPTCGNGYWANSAGNICSPCASTCTYCVGPTSSDCASCGQGDYLHPFSGKCSATCPLGYYPSDATRRCSPCDKSCTTCFGPSNQGCTSCNSRYFLQPDSTSCFDSCPAGYWKDSSSNKCLPCRAECVTCSGPSSDSCFSCNKEFYLQPASGSCNTSCPEEGYYPDNTTNTCSPCDEACASCFGPNNIHCQTCHSGYFLQLPPSDTICLDSCLGSDYCADSLTNSCQICPPFYKWPFWMVSLHVVLFIAILLVVRTCNKDYSLLNKLREKQALGIVVKPHWSYKVLMSWLTTHPLLSIFLYKDAIITKSQKSILFFLRMLLLYDIAGGINQPKVLYLKRNNLTHTTIRNWTRMELEIQKLNMSMVFFLRFRS